MDSVTKPIVFLQILGVSYDSKTNHPQPGS